MPNRSYEDCQSIVRNTKKAQVTVVSDTLTCMDDLTRTTNALEQNYGNALKVIWQDLSALSFDIGGF